MEYNEVKVDFNLFWCKKIKLCIRDVWMIKINNIYIFNILYKFLYYKFF